MSDEKGALDFVPVQAEIETIAGCLMRPEMFPELRSIVTPDQFWYVEFGIIWHAMSNLYISGKEMDLSIIAAELERMGHEEIRSSRLGELCLQTMYSRHAPQHAQVVAEYARRREAAERLPEMRAILLDKEKSYDDATSEATSLYQGALGGGAKSKELTLSEIAGLAESKIFETDEQQGVSFMVSELDDICGAMIPGDAVLVAARTGVGKTRYCTQLALTEAQRGNRVLFMTTEEAEFQTHWRLVEMLSRGALTVKDMRSGRIRKDQDKAAKYLELSEVIKKLPIEIVRVNGWDVGRVAARIAKHGPNTYRVVLVDYLELLGVTPGWEKQPDHKELAHRMNMLKNAALDQQTVVIVPSQINRDGADRDNIGPQHVAGSDGIVRAADIMLAIQRDENSGGSVTFRVSKTRWADGLGRKVTGYWDQKAGMYGSMATEEQQAEAATLPLALQPARNGKHKEPIL